jgi:hypothetical protein
MLRQVADSRTRSAGTMTDEQAARARLEALRTTRGGRSKDDPAKS